MRKQKSSSGLKVWNINFSLLWQGQLVSMIGDVFYEIALGFWILAVTGSTALMGTLMAASTIPRVILSPLAGVWVDRLNRKWLLVGMDLIRGIAIAAVAAAALLGVLEIWMVFAAGILIGICAAVFNPAVSSVVPDLVDPRGLIKANSAFSMVRAGSGILGNSGGGIFYALLGAPVMFLINGISYLISSATELFIRIPAHPPRANSLKIWEELQKGFRFTWQNKGLRYLFLGAAVINFFSTMAIILLLPFFQRTEWLGPAAYGITMAALTAGMLAGMVLLSILDIPPEKRSLLFAAGAITMSVAFILFPFLPSLWLLIPVAVLGGAANAVINVLIDAVVQMTVPQNMRGKVFGLLGTISQGLTPIGMALGGILGEWLPLRTVIAGAMSIVLAVVVIIVCLPDFTRFINYNPDKEAP